MKPCCPAMMELITQRPYRGVWAQLPDPTVSGGGAALFFRKRR